jgi:hypothetical protein
VNLKTNDKGIVLAPMATSMPLSFSPGRGLLKAVGYHPKAALTVSFIQSAALVTYAVAAFRAAVGYLIITCTSAYGAGNLAHENPAFHLLLVYFSN